MKGKRRTKKQVMDAMEQCTKTIECGGCPYMDYQQCKIALMKDALRIMEDQEERIAIMTEGKRVKHDA